MSGKPMSKDLNPFPQGKKNQDLLQRLNHLYQANTYLASLSRELGSSTAEAGPSRSGGKKGRKGLKRQSVGDEQTNSDALGVVARRSNHRFKVMVKHNILATDPALKRSFCKGCNSICIPGLNARVRVKSSKIHGNKIITTCLTCSASRTIPAPPIQVEVAQAYPAVEPNPITEGIEDVMEGHIGVTFPLPSLPPPAPAATLSAIPPLDGINRSAKRLKLSKKPQFWRKEAALGSSPPEMAPVHGNAISSKAKQVQPRGATVSMSNAAPAMDIAKVPGDTPLDEENANDALPEAQVVPVKQRQQKVPKQKGQKGGKGGNVAYQTVKQNGHLVWRGDELVTGWGDPVPPPAVDHTSN